MKKPTVLVVDRVSHYWREAGEARIVRLAFKPGSLVDPQPVSRVGATATEWTWRELRWMDGLLAPLPFENCGPDGWRWAGRMVGECIPCQQPVTLVRRGSDYVCAECRAHVPGREARPREVVMPGCDGASGPCAEDAGVVHGPKRDTDDGDIFAYDGGGGWGDMGGGT